MRYITAQGVRGEFYLRLKQLMSAWVDRLSIPFDSNSASEDYAWLGTPPGLTEVKGEKRGEQPAEYHYSLRNREFDGGLNINRTDIERDKTGQIMAQVGEFGIRCGNHWIELLSTLMLAGVGTTLGKCYDGQNFFSASHGERKSGTQKNLLVYGDITELSVVAAAKPTSTEAVNAILAVITWMLGYKDDMGYPMNSDARDFLVMTSPALWSRLVPAVVNNTINQGDTNTIVSLKADGFNISVMANPLLTYTVDFDVYRADAPLKPFIRQEEIPLELDVLGPESEHYRLNNQMLIKGYARRAVGYGRWQYAAHATLHTT
jgi:phage major head subunit gpT-like protein